MGIEGGGGSGGGSAGGGGPVGGGSGSIGGFEDGGVAVASSVGISAPTMEIGVPSFSPNIVNEGPVELSFLENTMPINLSRFNPVGEIIFNPFQGVSPEGAAEPLSPVEIMAEVESIVSQTQANPLTEQDALSEVNNWLGITKPQVETASLPTEVRFLPEKTIIEEAEIVVQQAWENYPNTKAEEVVANIVNPVNGPVIDYLIQPAMEPSPVLEPALKTVTVAKEQVSSGAQVALEPVVQAEQAEQVVKSVLVEEEVKKDQKPQDQEEESELRIKHVEDEEVSMERKREVKEALAKASIEAQRLGLKKILGWMVAKFLPAENEDNRSQIVKRTGPDGSYQETVEAISTSGEFSSEEEAVTRFDEIVAEKKPVKRAKDGSQVTRLDIARVLKYLVLKVQPLPEVVEKRVVKKTVVQPTEQSKEVKRETTLEDFPTLAEVFQKAA